MTITDEQIEHTKAELLHSAKRNADAYIKGGSLTLLNMHG